LGETLNLESVSFRRDEAVANVALIKVEQFRIPLRPCARVQVARMAADRGVRVFTVGFGSPDGEIVGWRGYRVRVHLDEDTLRQIAELTRGRYFHAATASDLSEVYRSLNSVFVMEMEETEVTALFAAARSELEGRGLEFIGPTCGEPGERWAHFRGPDGNVYEMTGA
jgi:hypothetical protein